MQATAHMPSHADVRVSREVAGGLANRFDWFWSVVMSSWSTAVLGWITPMLTEPPPTRLPFRNGPSGASVQHLVLSSRSSSAAIANPDCLAFRANLKDELTVVTVFTPNMKSGHRIVPDNPEHGMHI